MNLNAGAKWRGGGRLYPDGAPCQVSRGLRLNTWGFEISLEGREATLSLCLKMLCNTFYLFIYIFCYFLIYWFLFIFLFLFIPFFWVLTIVMASLILIWETLWFVLLFVIVVYLCVYGSLPKKYNPYLCHTIGISEYHRHAHIRSYIQMYIMTITFWWQQTIVIW